MITHDTIMSSTRMAGQVRRYHTWPVLRQQQVDSHTWQVMRLYVELFGRPDESVWEYILFHDVAEVGTGDTPSDVKTRNPKLKECLDRAEEGVLESMGIRLPKIKYEEFVKVRVCDRLERFEFALEELNMGNKYAEPILRGARTAVEDSAAALGPVEARRISAWVDRKESEYYAHL